MFVSRRRRLVGISAAALLAVDLAHAQQSLPTIVVGRQVHAHTHSHGNLPAHTHTHVHPIFARVAPPSRVARPAPVAAAPIVTAAPTPEPKPPASAASEKYFTGEEINALPVSRPGEALEIVPGLIVSQHSGEGKANQYFLRGFNLDHGTDLSLSLDGMPLNMPTHGHGQGYADANFLIPELLSSVVARKGPYYADEGDFSSAGAVRMQYLDRLDPGVFAATGGSFAYGRLFGAKSFEIAGGNLLTAVETSVYNGPWVRPDEVRKINGVFRWSRGTQADGVSLTAMAYANRWYSTDQIPSRAVSQGLLPLWGTLDATDGGDTTRFSLSGRWSQTEGNHSSRVEAYAIRSTLNLFNNFTYFLGGHLLGDFDLGDQFRQFDRRTVVGLKAQHAVDYSIAEIPVQTRIGLQGRFDDIRLGLQNTVTRQPYETIRNDHVAEASLGLWTDTTLRWTPWLRTTGGVRVDFFRGSVTSLQDALSSPKAGGGPGQETVAPIFTGPFNNGFEALGHRQPQGGAGARAVLRHGTVPQRR